MAKRTIALLKIQTRWKRILEGNLRHKGKPVPIYILRSRAMKWLKREFRKTVMEVSEAKLNSREEKAILETGLTEKELLRKDIRRI